MLGGELRALAKLMLPLFVSGSLFATAMADQPPVIFLVRHAERAGISGHVPSDTGLSEVGRAERKRCRKL